MTKFQVCKRNKVYILHLLIKKTQKFLDSIHSKEGMIVVNFTLSNYPLPLSVNYKTGLKVSYKSVNLESKFS